MQLVFQGEGMAAGRTSIRSWRVTALRPRRALGFDPGVFAALPARCRPTLCSGHRIKAQEQGTGAGQWIRTQNRSIRRLIALK